MLSIRKNSTNLYCLFWDNITYTWKNFRLVAFDGTTVWLPASKQIKNCFGIHSSKKIGSVNCLAQCLLCVDVLSNYILNYRLDKMCVSEKQMFREMLPDVSVVKKYKYNWQNAYRFTRNKMIELCFSQDIYQLNCWSPSLKTSNSQ